MFLKKRKVNDTYYWSLAENYREGGKVKQKLILSLGTTEKAVEILKQNKEYKKFLCTVMEYMIEDESNVISINAAPVLKYPGAKWSMAEWIISYLPKHTTYLEPYFGSGAVFFKKSPSKIETINDIDGNVVNLFKVIREYPEELARLIKYTPWARDEYYSSYEKTDNEIENARRFLVRCWQAFGAKTSDRTGWRSNIKANSGNIASWDARLPQNIIECANRLKNVQIESQPAIKLIQRYNQKTVCIYADPPYPLETRSKRMYANEMAVEDHVELLNTLDQHSGPVILSGYACELYDNRLEQWKRVTKKALAEGGREREEVLWINPIAAADLKNTDQMQLSII